MPRWDSPSLLRCRPGGDGNTKTLAAVSPEQIAETAQAFQLHESVAGPLRWYAAGESKIEFASAEGVSVADRPVAMLLRLAPADGKGTASSYVVICRNNQSATIELPGTPAGHSELRVHVAPSTRNGGVQMRYAIAVAPSDAEGGFPAALTGQRRLGLTPQRLGQMVLSDQLIDVTASAWPVDHQLTP